MWSGRDTTDIKSKRSEESFRCCADVKTFLTALALLSSLQWKGTTWRNSVCWPKDLLLLLLTWLAWPSSVTWERAAPSSRLHLEIPRPPHSQTSSLLINNSSLHPKVPSTTVLHSTLARCLLHLRPPACSPCWARAACSPPSSLLSWCVNN